MSDTADYVAECVSDKFVTLAIDAYSHILAKLPDAVADEVLTEYSRRISHLVFDAALAIEALATCQTPPKS